MQNASGQKTPKQDISMNNNIELPSKQSKSPTGFRFLDLPPEIKNRVYRELFSGKTIHLDGTAANPKNVYTLSISTCTTPQADYLATKNFAGIPHTVLQGGNGTTTTTFMAHTTEGEVCDSSLFFLSNHICRQHVHLSTQVLSTCRQIHSEAALIPFATNAFMFSGGLYSNFRAAFDQKFTPSQRRAIRTAVVPAIFEGQVDEVPGLIPGVKYLWLEDAAPWIEDKDVDEETWAQFP